MQNVRASALPPGPCKCLSNPVIMAKNMKENVLGKTKKIESKTQYGTPETGMFFAGRNNIK